MNPEHDPQKQLGTGRPVSALSRIERLPPRQVIFYLVMLAISVMFWVQRASSHLPAWAVAILVGRDLLALVGSLLIGSKIRVNRVGKAATAVLMAAVAVVVIVPGAVVGEIMFYAGFGLSIAAGLMYVRSARCLFGGGELR